jgi:hypothetical protein
MSLIGGRAQPGIDADPATTATTTTTPATTRATATTPATTAATATTPAATAATPAAVTAIGIAMTTGTGHDSLAEVSRAGR